MMTSCWECCVVGEVHHHHPVPKSRGGARTIPLCLGCHAKAHGRAKNMASATLTRTGLAQVKAEGGRLGADAFGWTRDDATDAAGRRVCADVLGEVAAVRRILAMRADGATYERIAAALTADGVPTKRGGAWTAMTVRRIAQRLSAQSAGRQ